jgi:L-ascorbate metabolism protein UlaG (beta-lactamase superfamily)
LTTGHFDHAMDVPALVKQPGAIVHAPGPVCQRLGQAGISPHSLECVTLHTQKRVGSLTWQALASRVYQADSSPRLRALISDKANLAHIIDLSQQWPLGEIVTFLFQADGLSLIHFGSAGWVESEIEGLQADIALLPVESVPTVNDNVVQLAMRLKPKVVIPHHWDNYYPPLSKLVEVDQFETMMQSEIIPPIKVYKPVIGERVDSRCLIV